MHPGPFAARNDQTGFLHYAQMAGHLGLDLLERCHEFAHTKLALSSEQREDAPACGVSQRVKERLGLHKQQYTPIHIYVATDIV